MILTYTVPSVFWTEATLIPVSDFVSIFAIFLRSLPITIPIYFFGTSIVVIESPFTLILLQNETNN